MTTERNPDLATQKLDALTAQVAWLVERQRKQDELISEMMPIAREVMTTATEKLDSIEKRGWFESGRALTEVVGRVLDHYKAEDVRALGDSIVSILDTVRALTQPEVLAIVGETSELVAHAEEAKPIGMMGLLRASKKKDVQKGMAVLMEVLGNMGRVAQSMVDRQDHQDKSDDQKARLAAVLGPKRNRANGTERPAAAPPATPRKPVATAPAAAKLAVAGVATKPDGHLVDPATWTRDVAAQIAEAEGVPLTPERWKLVEVARAEFEEKKAAANIRRLTQISGLATKDIFALFPKAPGRTIAKIAGTPKPAGCI